MVSLNTLKNNSQNTTWNLKISFVSLTYVLVDRRYGKNRNTY